MRGRPCARLLRPGNFAGDAPCNRRHCGGLSSWLGVGIEAAPLDGVDNDFRGGREPKRERARSPRQGPTGDSMQRPLRGQRVDGQLETMGPPGRAQGCAGIDAHDRVAVRPEIEQRQRSAVVEEDRHVLLQRTPSCLGDPDTDGVISPAGMAQ